MKILITGATGFIGKNLIGYIKENGIFSDEDIILLSSQDVVPYKRIDHKNYTFTKEDFYQNNIFKIDTVIHLGAFTPKANNEANDLVETSSNINNTIHLLNNLPNIPRKFIYISTIDVYKKTDEIIDENSDTKPDSLYGWSKLYCEKIVEQSAIRMGFIPQILRVGHIFGIGEEKYKKLIPETIRKVINNEEPSILSNGQEKRSFLYITDCCRAILKSILLNEYVNPINIVSNTAMQVKDVIQIILDISEKDLSCEIQNRNIQVNDFVFSNEKMQTCLCSEEVNLYEGLRIEYEYFLNLYHV